MQKKHRFRLSDIERILRNALADDDEPEQILQSIANLRGRIDSLERQAVIRCRENGMTWEGIANELGLAKCTVHQKYKAAAQAAGK